MGEEQLKKLRGYYHALLNQQRLFDDPKVVERHSVESGAFKLLAREIASIRSDLPDLLPPFEERTFFSHQGAHEVYYNISAIRSYLAVAVAKLKVAIDVPESAPVTERREFAFVKDPDLRKIIERDYLEIQQDYVVKSWKSVIILCGGAIEAILTDIVLRNSGAAKAASKAPKEPDITKWDLSDLINVAVELKLVSPGVEKLSHSVREYRNLVHPGNELRRKLVFNAEEAKIALEVLHIVHRDLSG